MVDVLIALIPYLVPGAVGFGLGWWAREKSYG